MSWKEEEILDGVFREELQQNAMTDAEQAKARMEEAVYGGTLHAEKHTAHGQPFRHRYRQRTRNASPES